MKTLKNTNFDGVEKNVSDVKKFGDGDLFKLVAKAWSENEGWMKSTKVMEIPFVGSVIQVTTQQGDNVAEALTFVPNAGFTNLDDPTEGLVKIPDDECWARGASK